MMCLKYFFSGLHFHTCRAMQLRFLKVEILLNNALRSRTEAKLTLGEKETWKLLVMRGPHTHLNTSLTGVMSLDFREDLQKCIRHVTQFFIVVFCKVCIGSLNLQSFLHTVSSLFCT